VPVIVASTLVYDDIARHRFLELVAPQVVSRLDELWSQGGAGGRAGRRTQGSLAERTLEIVLERAAELSPDLIAPHHIGPVATFADRYTARGRMPADRLTELLARDPAEALEWATAG
jgi:hypothetical protein